MKILEKEWLSPKDLIEMGLGSQGQIYKLFAREDFPLIKLGKSLRVKRVDLEKWLNEQMPNR